MAITRSSIGQTPFPLSGKSFHHPENLHGLAVSQFTRVVGTSSDASTTALAQGLMNL
jgi:hypothetical protein